MVSKFLIRMDYVYLSRYEFQNYIHICICIYDCYIFYAHFHCSIFILIEKTHTHDIQTECAVHMCVMQINKHRLQNVSIIFI